MKKIRIKFTDFYGTPPEHIWEYGILRRLYDVELVERDPDYILDGGLGTEHLAYPDAIRIVRIGESYVPDFNQFDYAIGFDFLDFGDRYLRVPLFAFYPQFRDVERLTVNSEQLGSERLTVNSEQLGNSSIVHRSPLNVNSSSVHRSPLNVKSSSVHRSPLNVQQNLASRDFCSFVVSNPDGDPLRLEFFKRLSKYKPVASGGGLLNNVGGRVPDKYAFMAKYKFNIAFENSTVPGYTTEKVMEPLVAQSVPIYYGNPRIAEDFDPACMVRVASRDDVERAVEEIIALDRDNEAYLAKLAAPKAVRDFAYYETRLTAFLRNIFDPPVAAARRLNAYGYQTNIRRRAVKAQKMYKLMHPGRWFK